MTTSQWYVNLTIGTCLLFLFAFGYIETFNWSFRASVFPKIVTGSGSLLSLIYVALHFRRTPFSPASLPSQGGGPDGDTEDLASIDRAEMESVTFGDAGFRDWARSLAWIAVFFCVLRLTGLYITVAVFTVIYLEIEAKARRVVTGIYAVALSLGLYAIFELLLSMRMPDGLLV